MAYLTLFLTSLIAATFFPLSSETLLVALLHQHYGWFGLWLVATLGNTLGSCINWYIGKQCLHLQHKKWFPVNAQQLQRAQIYFQRYGIFTLLFAWVPIIGDPLTFFAGALRIIFWKFFILVLLGKAVRYGVVILLALEILAY